jgi:hypothetical protein
MQHLHIYTKQVKLIISNYTPASQKHSDKMNHSKAVWGVPMVKKVKSWVAEVPQSALLKPAPAYKPCPFSEN